MIIQANKSGSRKIEVSEENLMTIQRFALFDLLIDSTGIVDEQVLDKLKLNIRSILTTEQGNCKELLDLCIDVIYNSNMKAIGLSNLMVLYQDWCKEHANG
ncbi:MAG: hypothetical protein MJY71_03980 [Bacteroidaceae bacterium]|nr:hypothetical protein [Bacteroidaceae bacterium]